MNWRLMSCAPKDGKPFLAWYEGAFGPPYGTMCWRPEKGGRFHSMTMGTQTKDATHWARPKRPAVKFCALPHCPIWFPDDGPACPNHNDPRCTLHGATDTGGK